jgi:hypothetical protein
VSSCPLLPTDRPLPQAAMASVCQDRITAGVVTISAFQMSPCVSWSSCVLGMAFGPAVLPPIKCEAPLFFRSSNN